MKNIDCNIRNLIINDFALIPTKLRKDSRFCLWKYEQLSNSRTKFLKKPYGINSNNQIIPSLKNRQYWFSLDKLNELSFELQKEYGLGLILTNGPYLVIDLDNCILIKNNQSILLEEVKQIIKLFPNAYCEISPSNTGLHIIFRGTWLINCNKAKRYLSQSLKQGTIEIYSGNDCRYITLTGNSLYSHIIKDDLPYFSLENNGLKELFINFFDDNEKNYTINKFITSDSIKQNETNISKEILNQQYNFFQEKILNSGLSNTYSSLCNSVNPGYSSPSEADWFYLNLILKFLVSDRTYKEKYFLLKYFYQKDRPERLKKNREDYIKITIEKVLIFDNCNNNVKKVQKNKFIYQNNNNIKKFDKKNILKLCNNMNIFYLNKPQRTSCRKLYKGSKNNYIEFIIPEPLTSIDSDYFSEILYQFYQQKFAISDNECLWPSEKYIINLNISLIAKRLNKSDGGSFRSSLIESLDKLSLVKMSFEKQIIKSGLVHKGVKDLISYETFFSNDLMLNKKYKKIIVEINFLTFNIMQNSSCHYSLLNIEHRNKLPSSQLRLLYHYLCLKLMPGADFFTDITTSELLKTFWSDTESLSTKRTRKKYLISLTESLKLYSNYLSDMLFIFPEIIGKKNIHADLLFRVKRTKATYKNR